MRYLRLVKTDEHPKLDLKDKKILGMLSKNSRLPATTISKKVGLSRDAVSYRIENLEKKGVIQGYKAIVDIKKFGYDSYHIFLQMKHTTKEAEEKLIEKLNRNPHIRAVLKFSGKYDLEIALVARNLEELDQVISQMLSECSEYINDYEIIGLTKNYVQRAFPKSFHKEGDDEEAKKATPKTPAKIDAKDEEILKKIANDASSPLHETANNLKLSVDAVKYRISKMVSDGTILSFTIALNYASIGYDIYAVLLRIPSLDSEKEKKLKQLLKTDENLVWAAKAIGRYNVLMYVCVDQSEKLHETIMRLREAFPMDIKGYETMVAYEEYKYTYFPENLDLRQA